mmetsp:Transcript_99134/g.296257  ORF Transcript_99134/g.296257 Transcript_99134/m.296257 type:complete len:204 (+) Transcript_99134:861-1472(+)
MRTPLRSPILSERRRAGGSSDWQSQPNEGMRRRCGAKGCPVESRTCSRSATSSKKRWSRGAGTAWPCNSTPRTTSFWNATPTMRAVAASTRGPPLLPLLMAASTVSARPARSECEYSWTSTRLTTPSVTLQASPPTGYPTTRTLSNTTGNSLAEATFKGTTSANAWLSSSTTSSARSTSWQTAATRARNFSPLKRSVLRCTRK